MLDVDAHQEDDMDKHHALYMRVSTKHQDAAGQEPELRRWTETHEGECRWYHDTYTGTSMDRPGFRLLLKNMEVGAVDTLVVWRLGRLGRTAKGLINLLDDLICWKVNLVSLRDGLDLLTPGRPTDGEHPCWCCGVRDGNSC